MSGPFDTIARDYDAWYDSVEGAAIFAEEVEALLLVKGRAPGRWLEVGVGTGRFASALGVSEGIDPSPEMLALSAARGINTRRGVAECLPYGDNEFDGVLFVVTLCFVESSARAFQECTRVLRPKGSCVVGIVPASSPWGQEYQRKAEAGHAIYSHATFFSVQEVVRLAAGCGLMLQDAASALLWSPFESQVPDVRLVRGARPDAGFVALRFERTS